MQKILKCKNCLSIKPYRTSWISTQKSTQKVSALSRVAHLMNFEQGKRILNALVSFQFLSFSLVVMSQVRKLNNCMNHIHKRALSFICKHYQPTFHELLAKDNELNLQELVTEAFNPLMPGDHKTNYAPDVDLTPLERQNL